MITIEKQTELFDKIIFGLEKAYLNLIEMKKQKNAEIVILQNNKIVKVKPQ